MYYRRGLISDSVCYMAHNGTRVPVYLDDDTLAALDRQRGPASRSAWIRALIGANLGRYRTGQDLHSPVPQTETPIHDQIMADSPMPGSAEQPKLHVVRPKVEKKTGPGHRFKKYKDSTKCEKCGQKIDFADPFCPIA